MPLISSVINTKNSAIAASSLTAFKSFSIPGSGSNVTVTVTTTQPVFPGMQVILTDMTQFMSGVITSMNPGASTVTVKNTASTGGAISGTMAAGNLLG